MTKPIDIRAGLKTALTTLGNIDNFNVSEYVLSTPVADTIWFFPEPVDYDLAGSRGLDEWQWCIQAFVALNIDKVAQMRLDELLASSGTASIKALVEAEPTLGGVVNGVRVAKAEGYQFFAGRDGMLLGSTWTLEILASG